MKTKYRIVKITKGKDTVFQIQSRFLFIFWHEINFLCSEFDTLEKAIEHLTGVLKKEDIKEEVVYETSI